MKSIRTMYKNTLFRSRLEADVAFLLDALDYKWEYEPISFMLDDGTHYIPDFWIPEIKLWVECRGYSSEKGNRQIKGFADWIYGGAITNKMTRAPRTLLEIWEEQHEWYEPYFEKYLRMLGNESLIDFEDAPEFISSYDYTLDNANKDKLGEMQYLVVGPNEVSFYEHPCGHSYEYKLRAWLCLCSYCKRWSIVGHYGIWNCRFCGAHDKTFHFCSIREMKFKNGSFLIQKPQENPNKSGCNKRNS